MRSLVLASFAFAAGVVQAAPALPSSDVVSACERATREALGNARGPAVDVSFNAPPAAQPASGDAPDQMLRGAGRVRAANGVRTFTYPCNVNANGEVSGVVVRDAASAAERPVVAARSVEPDLSNVSPVACESAAAAALKRRWPNVSAIQFSADTRSLEQDSAGVARLRGQGTALPNPAAPSTHFSYQCEIDARNGRVTATRLND